MNNTQKVIIILFLINLLLRGFYKTVDQLEVLSLWLFWREEDNGINYPQLIIDGHLTSQIGVGIILIIGFFLFKSSKIKYD